MSDDTRPSSLLPRPEVPDEVIAELRAAIAAVRKNPGAARLRELRNVAAKTQAWETTAELLEEAVDAATSSPIASVLLRGLVDVLLVLGRATEAEAAYDRLRVLDPDGLEPRDEVRLLEKLTDVYDRHLDLPHRATTVLERLVTLLPSDAPLFERLARLATQAELNEVAARAWERYAELVGNDERGRPALHAAAKLRQKLGQQGQAAALYRALLLRDPEDHRAETALAQLGLQKVAPARAPSQAPEEPHHDDPITAEHLKIDIDVDQDAFEPAAGRAASQGASGSPRAAPPAPPRPDVRDEVRAELRAVLTGAASLIADARPAEAATFLRDALAPLTEESPEVRGVLVFHWARACAAAGDADEAYTLLHEAHRLRPRDLLITLELGESCYTRRRWREASVLLGELGRHPDARVYPVEVARGLARAAEAEARQRHPEKVEGLARAAVELDPGCALAWHVLAEGAMERGETAEAAEHLEREATVTTDPQVKLRVFDALGDLALEVLADPPRAARCYASALDAAPSDAVRTRILAKLAGALRGLGPASAGERAAVCAQLATLAPDRRAKAALLAEAIDGFLEAGDRDRARATAERFVDEDPLDEVAVRRAAELALADDEPDVAATLLGRAFAAWARAGLSTSPARAPLSVLLGDARSRRGDARGAEAAYEQALAAVAAPNVMRRARRGLVALAPGLGRPVRELLGALVEDEHDPEEISAYARALEDAVDAGDGTVPITDARALAELAIALGLDGDARHDGWITRHPSVRLASDQSYATVLDEPTRRAVIDAGEAQVLGAALELLWEAAPLIVPAPQAALEAAGFTETARVAAVGAPDAVVIFGQLAKAFAGPTLLLHTTGERGADDATLVLTSPPVLVFGPRLASRRARLASDVEAWNDAVLRFTLARLVELARPARIFAAGATPEAFAELVAGLRGAFGSGAAPAPDPEAARIRQAVPVRLRARLTELLARATDDDLDPVAYRAACERAADRAGLLACRNVGVALDRAGGRAAAPHLVRMACARAYLDARRRLSPEQPPAP